MGGGREGPWTPNAPPTVDRCSTVPHAIALQVCVYPEDKVPVPNACSSVMQLQNHAEGGAVLQTVIDQMGVSGS